MRVHAVIRLSADAQNREALKSAGETLNGIWPGAFKGLRKNSARPAFDGDVARGESWESVVEELWRFSVAARDVAEELSGIGAEGIVDIGVWLPASQRTQLYSLTLESRLHKGMGQLGWSTEISLYVESAVIEDEEE